MVKPKPKYWVEINKLGFVEIKGYRKKHRFTLMAAWRKGSRYSRNKAKALDFCWATGLELREGKK